jgi:hypothetical protein
MAKYRRNNNYTRAKGTARRDYGSTQRSWEAKARYGKRSVGSKTNRGSEKMVQNTKVTVRATGDHYPYFAESNFEKLGYWRIPVTEVVVKNESHFERYNERKEVFIKGVSVRFILNMLAGTSVIGAMYDARIQDRLVPVCAGDMDDRPMYFDMGEMYEGTWILLNTESVGMLRTGGPFAMVSGGHEILLDSSDASLHRARTNRDERKQIGVAEWRDAEGEARKRPVFRQNYTIEGGGTRVGTGPYERKSVRVYFAVGKKMECAVNAEGQMKFERPLEIVMGVQSHTQIEGFEHANDGSIPVEVIGGKVSGVMVDVYYRTSV